MADERILLQSGRIFRWDGPKRKPTMFSATVGRLVLTSRRFLYYSAGNAMLGGGEATLDKPGALDCPIAAIRSAELTSKWSTLTVTWLEGSGEVTATFAEKVAGLKDGATWVSCIRELRTDPGAAESVEMLAPGEPSS